MTREGWRSEAACAGQDLKFWFPTRDTPDWHVKHALLTCASCPVKDQCLLEHISEPEGIFGGMGPRKRQRLRTKRRRWGLPVRPVPKVQMGSEMNRAAAERQWSKGALKATGTEFVRASPGDRGERGMG